MRLILLSLLILTGSAYVQAEGNGSDKPDSIPFYEMTLEQLMNVSVSVASDLPMTNRESPGIVSVITQDEIRKSGAHDLIQVLQSVPGFDFGFDVEGIVGVSVRGNWGHEGKVLMLWDGMEMNEDLYSTLQFGGHYPLGLIKRIEIIRGPGSAMYGANAEYAVINIITETSELNGIASSVSASTYENTLSGQETSFAIGKKIEDGRVNFSASIIDSKRSNQRYIDNFGSGYSMADYSGLNSTQFKLEYVKKGFSLIGLCDNYVVKERDGYEAIYLRSYENTFFTSKYVAKYDISLDRLKITPGLKFAYSKPWYLDSNEPDDNYVPFKTSLSKGTAFTNLTYEPNAMWSVIAGAQYSKLQANDLLDSSYFSNGKKVFGMENANAYAQAIYKSKIANIIIGGRFNHNQYYGQKFVPRLGLTRIWDKFHVKALFSQAFRAPSVENINFNPDIKSESTTFVELEFGFKVTQHSYLTVNTFDITTKDAIVYYYNEFSEDDYRNETTTGSRGFEVEYKWKTKKWFFNMNYSYYTTAGHPVIDAYRVPGHSDILLAFPNHKIHATASYNFFGKWSVTPSLSYLSKRYSVITNENDEATLISYNPALYLNINISAENILAKGLSLGLACHNATDESAYYIQPYANNHATVPAGGREYTISLHYNLSFKK